MSQSGSATIPQSRRRSKSPAGANDQPSLSTALSAQAGGHDGRPGLAGLSHINGDRRFQQYPPRNLGVHNILNPSEPQHSGQEGSHAPSTARPHEPELTTPGSTPGSYPPSRPFFPGHNASASLPGTPIPGSMMTPMAGSASGRNSPTTGYPFPASANPRRILSPRPPRATSMSHSGPLGSLDTRQPPFAATASPIKRPLEMEGAEDRRPYIPGLHHHSGVAPSPHGPPHQAPAPVRSLSQPIARSPGMSPNLPLSTTPIHPQPTQVPFQPEASPARSFSTTGSTSEGAAPWSEMIRRHGMGAALVGGDGQQAYMTLPGSDTPIPVQVDYSQASKKADEKRQRNAVASTRHRRKKKIMQEESAKQLQDLTDKQQEMAAQLDQMASALEFYRRDRNRLRDVVARNPSMSEHANCPPSPTYPIIRPLGDRSPSHRNVHIATPSQGYASETSSVERPAQRRRTDERPEFSMPVYEPPSGGPSTPTLPPMHGQVYGVPPRPLSAASSGAGDRLPPLRAMDGPPPSGQPHEQDPRTGQWIPVQPRQHETGWATAPRRPLEGPPR